MGEQEFRYSTTKKKNMNISFLKRLGFIVSYDHSPLEYSFIASFFDTWYHSPQEPGAEGFFHKGKKGSSTANYHFTFPLAM